MQIWLTQVRQGTDEPATRFPTPPRIATKLFFAGLLGVRKRILFSFVGNVLPSGSNSCFCSVHLTWQENKRSNRFCRTAKRKTAAGLTGSGSHSGCSSDIVRYLGPRRRQSPEYININGQRKTRIYRYIQYFFFHTCIYVTKKCINDNFIKIG